MVAGLLEPVFDGILVREYLACSSDADVRDEYARGARTKLGIDLLSPRLAGFQADSLFGVGGYARRYVLVRWEAGIDQEVVALPGRRLSSDFPYSRHRWWSWMPMPWGPTSCV
jgi:hypothetical protein